MKTATPTQPVANATEDWGVNMAKYCTLDFETSTGKGIHGPSWKDLINDIYTVIYGTRPSDIKLLHKQEGYDRTLPEEVVDILETVPTIVGVNLKFDLGYVWHDDSIQRWLRAGGKIWDCQIAKYLLSGQRHSFPSLAEMQSLYLGIQTKSNRISYLFKKGIGADNIIYAGTTERSSYVVKIKVEEIGGILCLALDIKHFTRKACTRLWKLYEYYGIEDGRTPLFIMQKQYNEAKARGMLKIIELYNQYLLALIMIEINGLNIDIPKAEQTYQEFSLKVVEYLQAATKLVEHLWNDKRLPVFNVNSGPHSSAILFGGDIACDVVKETGEVYKGGARKGQKKTRKEKEDVHVKGIGLNPLGLTNETKKKGVYQTGEDVVNAIYDKSGNQLAKDYCKLLKLSATYKQKISTYLNAFLYRSVDGIVRPNFNNTETATGRLSCSNPNAQNLPSHGEFRYSIQGLIVAPEGWTCVSIDFSQLETYCRALLTREETLVADLVSGKDFHVQNMTWGYNITYEEGLKLVKEDPVWKERRSEAKKITFGEAYGQMEDSMAKATGWDVDLVKQVYANMYLNYPGLVDYDKIVTKSVTNSARIGSKKDLPAKNTNGNVGKKGLRRMFNGSMELLPIRQRDKKTYEFNYDTPRHIGWFISPTGKQYAFEEFGSRTKNGDVFKYFKPTQMKNYPMQGLAGDIQAITTVELFQYLLENGDKVRIVNEIHDSKWFIIKDEYVPCILPKVCAIISNVRGLLKERFDIDVPFEFKVDAETGKDFANMVPFKGE